MAKSKIPKKYFLCFLVYLIFLSINSQNSSAQLQRFKHPPKEDGSLSLLVVGDWGRRGDYNQSQVASQMGIVGEKLDIDFVISTGDNFYEDGLKGVDDSAFEDSFSKIYTSNSLQKQWYNVLGNHDYRGDVEAQLSPVLRKLDNRWLCLRSFIVDTEIAEFFFVDTTPFVEKYFTKPKDHVYDWSGILPREVYLSNLLKDVDKALKESNAKWKIVVGHHTIKSAGHHGNTQEIGTQLLPILEENNVDFYINGHDHCLEHISSSRSPIQFFTSGGGSKAWRGGVSWLNPKEMKFYYDGQGFMSVQITQTQVDFVFFERVIAELEGSHFISTHSQALSPSTLNFHPHLPTAINHSAARVLNPSPDSTIQFCLRSTSRFSHLRPTTICSYNFSSGVLSLELPFSWFL